MFIAAFLKVLNHICFMWEILNGIEQWKENTFKQRKIVGMTLPTDCEHTFVDNDHVELWDLNGETFQQTHVIGMEGREM